MRRDGTPVWAALTVLATVSSCTDYKQTYSATRSIYDVRVTTRPAEVEGCRRIVAVDSRDSARGCGLTVQPTPEECLRYQVRLAGGDTLLIDGPVGVAYECSASVSTETPPTPPPTSAPEPPQPTPTAGPAAPTQSPAGPAPTPVPLSPTPPGPAVGVRITAEREDARGCVYLGDVAPELVCADQSGQASADCADQALQAGGDLILLGSGRAQIFSCKARP